MVPRGSGRVYDDGSVIGTIQVGGTGSDHLVWLPAGTLKVEGEAICASLDSVPFKPCFDLYQTGDESFRGAVHGSDFAYCDFTPRSDSNRTARLQPSEPLSPPTHNRSVK